jgi:tRNA(Ile)-lysidine synthase
MSAADPVSNAPRVSKTIARALERALAAFPAEARFLIAFSGGVDSVVLLHAAVTHLGVDRCIAAHINHGLSPDADAWQIRAAAFADTLGVSFTSRRVHIIRGSASSLEAHARDARYAALSTLYLDYGVDALLLGQHADDQAETVLLQLLRGAGLPGLAAMGAQAADGYGMQRLRPLLACTRGEIEAYARHHGLSWVEDASNLDTRFARNALRHEVTPQLEQHFPGYREALARAARHAADAQVLVEDLGRLDLAMVGNPALPDFAALGVDAAAAGPYRLISRAAFTSLSEPRAANLLRYWMRELDLPAAPAARLDAALRQIRSAREGAAIRVDHAGHVLRIYRGLISWELGVKPVDEDDLPAPQYLTWHGQSVWRLPEWRGTLVFAPAQAGAGGAIPAAWLNGKALSALVREGGERMRTGPAGRLRKLKNLFQENRIAAWNRQLPLLFIGDTLLWVPGLGFNYDAFAREPVAPDAAGPWLTIEWRVDLTVA